MTLVSLTVTRNKFILSVSPDDYGLIQIFCNKYSFLVFYIIVIRLEAL